MSRITPQSVATDGSWARVAFWQLTFAFVWQTVVAAFIRPEQFVQPSPSVPRESGKRVPFCRKTRGLLNFIPVIASFPVVLRLITYLLLLRGSGGTNRPPRGFVKLRA